MQPVDPCNPEAPAIRYDAQGRRLCNAHSVRTGLPCNSPAMHGMKVCRMHGGGAPAAKNKARLRLLALVDPALGVLAGELKAETSADRQRAANSILDRAGIGRVTKIGGPDARELLYERLMELRASRMEDDVIGSEYPIEGRSSGTTPMTITGSRIHGRQVMLDPASPAETSHASGPSNGHEPPRPQMQESH